MFNGEVDASDPQWTETGLLLPETYSFDQWQETGGVLGRIERSSAWWVGDWLNFGERKYGETFAQGAEATGLDPGTLSDYAAVAARIELPRRRGNLSFGHHREVAYLEVHEQEEWFDRSEREGWSIQELRRQRRQRRLPAPRPLPAGRFAVIYADPPWRYEHAPGDSRSIENQYPTMELDEIKALDVPAAEAAILFLWTTSPKLAESLEVVDAWEFDYRTCLVWVKDRIGMGYYARQKHELLLVGKRGDMPAPDERELPPSVIEAPRGRHSEKPEEFYTIIERLYPGFAYLELFARKRREGWASWINEAEAA